MVWFLSDLMLESIYSRPYLLVRNMKVISLSTYQTGMGEHTIFIVFSYHYWKESIS